MSYMSNTNHLCLISYIFFFSYLICRRTYPIPHEVSDRTNVYDIWEVRWLYWRAIDGSTQSAILRNIPLTCSNKPIREDPWKVPLILTPFRRELLRQTREYLFENRDRSIFLENIPKKIRSHIWLAWVCYYTAEFLGGFICARRIRIPKEENLEYHQHPLREYQDQQWPKIICWMHDWLQQKAYVLQGKETNGPYGGFGII